MKQRNLWREVLTAFITGSIGLVLIAAFFFLLIEWASGCGESYVDSKGVTHVETCE
jgi:hypothetical protein